MYVRALLAAVAWIAATALVPACDDAGADTEGAAHDAGGRDGAPPARNFDEYGVWVDPGSSDERPVDPLVLRYGEPTLLYATEEGVFRWDGAAQEATALLPPTTGGGFDFPAEQSADGDALLVLVQQALFVVPVSAGEPVEVARDVSVFGWLPDGERFVYVAEEALFVGARSGGTPVRIADGAAELARAWIEPSPDSEWIVFMGFDGEDDTQGCHRLRAARSDGSRVLELAAAALEPSGCVQTAAPAWSADGRYVAFAEGHGFRGDAWSRIAVFDVDSGKRLEALERVEYERDRIAYAWHPSESRLAYADGSGDAQVRLFDPRDETRVDLGRAEGAFARLVDGSGLSWDPHGEFIAFCTRDGLWQADLATGRTRRRMAESQGACAASLAPGGNWLAAPVQYTPESSRSVYRIVATRGTHAVEVELHQLPSESGDDGPWAPDGSRFAYVRDDAGADAGAGNDYALHMIAPDGSSAVRFGALGEYDGGYPLTWLWPDFAVNSTSRHSASGGLRLLDVALSRAEHVPHHALLGGYRYRNRQRLQRAFCSLAIVGGMAIPPIDEDEATTAPGTGLEQLVLWWQDEPGGAWQQRVLDERPNGDGIGDCHIP